VASMRFPRSQLQVRHTPQTTTNCKLSSAMVCSPYDPACAAQFARFVPLIAGLASRLVGIQSQQGGLDLARYHKWRPSAAALLDDAQQHRILAALRGQPPPGRNHWMVRLVAGDAVKTRLVP
jgi:hypothetical protein